MRVRDHRHGGQRPVYNRASHRLRELERIICFPHGTVLDTDDADIYLVPVAHTLRHIYEKWHGPATTEDILDRLKFWAERKTSQLPSGMLEACTREAMRRRNLDKADALAIRLRLTYAERKLVRLEVRLGARLMRAAQAVQKASDANGDQHAAPYEPSDARAVELQLLRVRRLAWWPALQSGFCGWRFAPFSWTDVSIHLNNRSNFYRVDRTNRLTKSCHQIHFEPPSLGFLHFSEAAYLPASNRFMPAPVSTSALTLPAWRTTSRMYPASTRRSRCSSGMVRCIGRVPTSFKDANSSLVSGGCENRDRGRAIPLNMQR